MYKVINYESLHLQVVTSKGTFVYPLWIHPVAEQGVEQGHEKNATSHYADVVHIPQLRRPTLEECCFQLNSFFRSKHETQLKSFLAQSINGAWVWTSETCCIVSWVCSCLVNHWWVLNCEECIKAIMRAELRESKQKYYCNIQNRRIQCELIKRINLLLIFQDSFFKRKHISVSLASGCGEWVNDSIILTPG